MYGMYNAHVGLGSNLPPLGGRTSMFSFVDSFCSPLFLLGALEILHLGLVILLHHRDALLFALPARSNCVVSLNIL
jgi:hypothetical protein